MTLITNKDCLILRDLFNRGSARFEFLSVVVASWKLDIYAEIH